MLRERCSARRRRLPRLRRRPSTSPTPPSTPGPPATAAPTPLPPSALCAAPPSRPTSPRSPRFPRARRSPPTRPTPSPTTPPTSCARSAAAPRGAAVGGARRQAHRRRAARRARIAHRLASARRGDDANLPGPLRDVRILRGRRRRRGRVDDCGPPARQAVGAAGDRLLQQWRIRAAEHRQVRRRARRRRAARQPLGPDDHGLPRHHQLHRRGVQGLCDDRRPADAGESQRHRHFADARRRADGRLGRRRPVQWLRRRHPQLQREPAVPPRRPRQRARRLRRRAAAAAVRVAAGQRVVRARCARRRGRAARGGSRRRARRRASTSAAAAAPPSWATARGTIRRAAPRSTTPPPARARSRRRRRRATPSPGCRSRGGRHHLHPVEADARADRRLGVLGAEELVGARVWRGRVRAAALRQQLPARRDAAVLEQERGRGGAEKIEVAILSARRALL